MTVRTTDRVLNTVRREIWPAPRRAGRTGAAAARAGGHPGRRHGHPARARRTPKPLTPLRDGRSILQRQLDGAARRVLGADVPITAVVGYRSELIMAAAPDLLFAYNPRLRDAPTRRRACCAGCAPPATAACSGSTATSCSTRRCSSSRCRYAARRPELRLRRHQHRRRRGGQVHPRRRRLHRGSCRRPSSAASARPWASTTCPPPTRPALIEHLARCGDQDYFERGIETAIARARGCAFRPLDISAFAAVEVDFETDLRAGQHPASGARPLLAAARPRSADRRPGGALSGVAGLTRPRRQVRARTPRRRPTPRHGASPPAARTRRRASASPRPAPSCPSAGSARQPGLEHLLAGHRPAHRDRRRPPAAARPDGPDAADTTTRAGGIPHGVVQHRGEGPLQQRPRRPRRAAPRGRRRPRGRPDAARRSRAASGTRTARGCAPARRRTGRRARRRHQRLEDVAHRPGRLVDRGERPGPLRRAPRPRPEQVHLRLDAGQRGAQLVAELVGELPLPPEHGGQPVEQAVEGVARVRRARPGARPARTGGRVLGAPPPGLRAHLLHRAQGAGHVGPQHQVDDDQQPDRERRAADPAPAAAPAGRGPATCWSPRSPAARRRPRPAGRAAATGSGKSVSHGPGPAPGQRRRPAGRGGAAARRALHRRAVGGEDPGAGVEGPVVPGVADDHAARPAPACTGGRGRLGAGPEHAVGLARQQAGEEQVGPHRQHDEPEGDHGGRRPRQPAAQAPRAVTGELT